MNVSIKSLIKLVPILYLFIVNPNLLVAQSTIKEYSKNLITYDFNDPNPIPILTSNPKIYPYFTFDGYQKNSTYFSPYFVGIKSVGIDIKFKILKELLHPIFHSSGYFMK